MIKYYIDKELIEDKAKCQLKEISEDENISKIVVFPDIHFASDKSMPVGIVFESDKVYPLVSGKDTGCGVAFMKIPKTNVLKKFDKNKYYNAFYREHLKMSDEGLGGGNHFLSLEEDKNNLYIIVHTGTRNLGIHWYQKNLTILSEFGNENHVTAEYLSENHPDWFWEYENLLGYSRKRRKEFIDGTLAFLIRNKIVEDKKFHINDSIHNYIEKDFNKFIHRKGATGLNGQIIIPLSMTRGSLIVESSFDDDNLNSCSHGAGRIMSRSATLKYWKNLKKKQRKSYETSFSELLSNGKFNTNQIQEFDFAYKKSDSIISDQPFINKVSETTPIVTIKFSEVR